MPTKKASAATSSSIPCSTYRVARCRAGVSDCMNPLAISLPATTMRLCSRSAGRTTMPSRPTARRFATPRITTRIRRLPPTTICGSSRSPEARPKNITADNPASDTSPLYSPDGRYIAYRAQQRPGYESDRFRLMLYDRKTGEKKESDGRLDRWVGTFIWSPDSKQISSCEHR